MVPVRKPGRPLSACPHPRDQTCGCGTQSVTAAIPRKQACHCGSNTPAPAQGAGPPQVSKPSNGLADLPSPTKSTFKIQKPNQQRPGSSRKQSFDPANLQRMDLNQVNILSPNTPVSLPDNYAPPTTQVYSLPQEYAHMQTPYATIPMQPPEHRQSIAETIAKSNGYSGMISNGGLEHVMESPLATPTLFANGDKANGGYGFPEAPIPQYIDSEPRMNGGSCCAPQKTEDDSIQYTNGSHNNHGLPPVHEHDAVKPATNGGSCCAPKKSHSQSSSSSSISEPSEVQKPSCCSGNAQPDLKQEPMSNAGTPQISHQMLPQNGMPYNQPFYQPYPPQPTVFTYPATYGSFQNPLQANLWRQNFREGHYTQMPIAAQGQLPFDAPLIPENLNTVHTCSCGDGCQCVGCAAHPFNDATQDYVRSAWESMSLEHSNGSSDPYTNGHTNGHTNGNGVTIQPTNGDPVASPNAHTPSSTASANGDEQSLSANDFFFVNYNFASDGCGGDTYSCPCGDDCQCIGCEIHKGGSAGL